MRTIRWSAQPPEQSVRVAGALGATLLEETGLVEEDLAALGFSGEPGQTIATFTPEGQPVLLVGLGDEVDAAGLRLAAGAAGRALPAATTISTNLHELSVDGAVDAVVTGFLAGSYRFDDYRSAPETGYGDVVLVGEEEPAELERSQELAQAVWRARDWVNRPPADKAPIDLAEEMASRLSDVGFDVEIWDEDRLVAERMGGLLGVAAGSNRPPRMLVAHRSLFADRAHLALVGKGIVFDSGGLSIKPADSMQTMKSDMAGGATVVGAAEVLGREGPGVSVYVPLTDNMSGGSAIKPGDVVTARNGKTIEVLNTDAEGRLVLADALSLAVEASPDLIVDVATLTGAARVALGNEIAALFGSDDNTVSHLLDAASVAGERLWALPMPEDQRRHIDSTVADMKNTAGRYGGAIAAAMLLAEFVGDVPWAHLDIAGPGWLREDGPQGPKGGSGFGVGTLVAAGRSLVAR